MKAHTAWKVLPHGPIEKLTENLWRVEGTLEGMPLGRVMTIVQRSDGTLVVHNAIALGEEEMRWIDEWGPVHVIIVPNGYHRLDARAYKDRYPDALIVCPAGARERVEEVVPVDMTYNNFAPDGAVELITLDGVGQQEGVMRVRSRDGVTLVFNDAVFNMPHGSGLSGLVFRFLTRSSGGPRVSRPVRWFVVKDRDAFRSHLERLAATPGLRRVIVSHVDMIEEGAANALRAAAATV